MTTPNKNAEKALAEEILDDARKRAERALVRARAEAEQLLAQARGEAESESERILADARAAAEKRAAMVLRTVTLEVARRQLAAREAIIGQVLGEAQAQLHALPADEYRRAVVGLAAAALGEMPGDEFVVEVAEVAGASLDAAALAAELSRRLSALGRNNRLQVQLSRELSAGVVVRSPDGRLRWDNTFAARIERLRAELRSMVAPVLFGET